VYSSPNFVMVVKPRAMRWKGHTSRMGELEMHTKFCRKTSKEDTT